ncbi:MAG: choice-of-anchor D domain-containing protein, partial [Spirochaetia bacterium]|nr:choice-of-anchor D domain-containing protein [Spirochaetia bacterium]
MFTLVNMPTLPASIDNLTPLAFTVNFIPTAVGDQTATVTITDNLARTEHTVTLAGAGTTDIVIGDGASTMRLPFDFFYKNSLFETIYTAAEMNNFNGMITGVKFFNNFSSDLSTGTPVKIWMGTTALTDLSAGWIPSGDLMLVYDGMVNFPSGSNIINIPFSTPFAYTNGQNVVLMANRPMDTDYYNSADVFQGQTVGTNRSRNLYSDSVTYDPTAPADGTLSGQFPKTAFVTAPYVEQPVFEITPDSHVFGEVGVGSNATQVFTIRNIGTGILSIQSVTIAGSPMMSLSGLPTFPVALAQNQTAEFTVNYAPTAVGNHEATITVTDNLPSRVAHPITVFGIGILDEELDPPTNLTATVTGHNVALNWDAPGETPPPPEG